MNRISHEFPDVDTLLRGVAPRRPVEGLLVDRVGLLDLIQLRLMDLHEKRRCVAGTPAESDVIHRIKYWDEVLGWIKEHYGSSVTLLETSAP